MNTKLLRQKILDLAIRGKLTEQKKSDGTTMDLLKQIQDERTSEALQTRDERGAKSSRVILSKRSASKDLVKEIIPLDKSEAPFEIPENWEWVRLGDVATLKGGKRVPAGKSMTTEPTSHIYIRVTDMRDGSIFDDDLHYVDDSIYEVIRNYTIGKEDLYITIAGTIGRVGLVPEKFDGMNLTENALKLTDIKADRVYLMFALSSTFVQDYFESTYHQVAMPKLSLTSAFKAFVPLPPLAEQQRIVETIENAFAEIASIENNQELLKKHIKQGRQKILDLAIRGKLTQQLKTDGTTKDLLASIMASSPSCHSERSAKGANSKNLGKSKKDVAKEIIPLDKTSAPFEIPENWEWVKLGDFVKQVTDFTASGSFASLRENVKYYKEENYALLVRTVDFRYGFKKDLTYTDQHGYEFLSNSNLFGGELLLSNIGSIGKVFIVPKLQRKMTLAPNSIMVRTINDEQRDWLYYFFLSPFGQQSLAAISSSTTQAKFNKTDLKGVLVPLPPLAEQQRIVATIQESFAEFDAMEKG